MTVSGRGACARSPTSIEVPTDLLVAGAWRPAGSGRRLEVADPATGTVLASVADADTGDAEAAVDAAAAAAADWAATAPRFRADLLMRAFELMHERSEELALLICLENGKSLADAAVRGDLCRRVLPLVRRGGRPAARPGGPGRRAGRTGCW